MHQTAKLGQLKNFETQINLLDKKSGVSKDYIIKEEIKKSGFHGQTSHHLVERMDRFVAVLIKPYKLNYVQHSDYVL